MSNRLRSLTKAHPSLPRALALLAAVAVLSARPAPAVDLGGLSGTLTGKERYKEVMAAQNAHGKLKKKVVSRALDSVAPAIAFTSGATADTGSFSITNYEDFPVTGTWTITATGAVTLAVDNAAFTALRGPEICPNNSCTPTATWTPKSAKLVTRTNTLKAKWLVTYLEANADGSYIQETFNFKGAGVLAQ